MIRKIMHRPQAVLGLAMMLLVFLVMLLAPVFAPNDPMQLNVAHSFAPPDAQYPLGTDELGRCILSRLIYGARASLSIALPTLLLLAVISTVVATLCAYIGGVLDRIFEVVSNIFMAFPPFLVAITLVGLFESKAASIVLSIVIAMWVWNARVVRTHVLRERNQPYVITCRMSGCSELRIVFRHIIPNILPHLLVLYSTPRIRQGALRELQLRFAQVSLLCKPKAVCCHYQKRFRQIERRFVFSGQCPKDRSGGLPGLLSETVCGWPVHSQVRRGPPTQPGQCGLPAEEVPLRPRPAAEGAGRSGGQMPSETNSEKLNRHGFKRRACFLSRICQKDMFFPIHSEGEN